MKQAFCRIVAILFFLITVDATTQAQQQRWLADAREQARVMLAAIDSFQSGNRFFPRSLHGDTLHLVPSNDWTSGFWPGILWMLSTTTTDTVFQNQARLFTARMNREPWNRNSHDVGFKVYDSYGWGYRLTGDTAYKRMIIEAAKTLCTRFNPKVGCIRSWDFGTWQYPVIIDNMMNLELLFAATRLSGDSTYYRVAVSHANTTLKNHFREDGSCYHVLDYDTTTGAVIKKTTLQGYADESVWARGQGWALYGFTMCYRETGDIRYLAQARKVAAYLLNNPLMPKDKIPFWDFAVPDLQQEPRDVSAAAVIASALEELSRYGNGKQYRKAAMRILTSLSAYYRAVPRTHHGFLLLHSTGHKPANSEVDTPIIYADYYYIEAILRSRGMKLR